MGSDNATIFETERLLVRTAKEDDIDLYLTLWTNPQVMTNVGFPQGLRTDRDKIRKQIQEQGGSEFDRLLVVVQKSNGESLGECYMSHPNEEGTATTDIKLFPEFWGNRYGVEVKKGLLSYLFTYTDCVAVEADPNVNNVASRLLVVNGSEKEFMSSLSRCVTILRPCIITSIALKEKIGKPNQSI